MSQGLLDAIAGALLKAGANVEIIAAAVGAYGAWFRLLFHNADAPQLLDQGPDRRDVGQRVDIAI